MPSSDGIEWWLWPVIRAEMARRVDHRLGVSQTEVALRGGLDQSDISKLLLNHKLGPTVETFMRTVMGLGLKPSEFFAELERGWRPEKPALSGGRVHSEAESEDDDLDRAIGRLVRRAVRRALDDSKRRKEERAVLPWAPKK